MNADQQIQHYITEQLIERMPNAGPCHVCGTTQSTRHFGPNREAVCGKCAGEHPERYGNGLIRELEAMKAKVLDAKMPSVSTAVDQLHNFIDAGIEPVQFVSIRIVTTAGDEYDFSGYNELAMTKEAMAKVISRNTR